MKVKYIIPYRIVVWRLYLSTFLSSYRGKRNKNNFEEEDGSEGC
jgi:hypothetical protein